MLKKFLYKNKKKKNKKNKNDSLFIIHSELKEQKKKKI